MYLAARLKLADAVGDQPASLSTIAGVTGTRPKRLHRLMRALAAHGFFQDLGNETFSHTPLSETLRSDRPGSMRAFAEAELGHDHYDSWRNVETCLREDGTAFERTYGMPIWRYYDEHPETNALFGEAMTNLTAIANAGILSGYQFASFRRVIDVGGGQARFCVRSSTTTPTPQRCCLTCQASLPTQRRPDSSSVIRLDWSSPAATSSRLCQRTATSIC